MIGYGFVGVSTIARQHMCDAVQGDPRSRVVAVTSRARERAQRFASDYDVPSAYDTLGALLDDSNVDVVYVSSTNELHCEQTLAAAAAGKHVLCEKPLALSIKDALEMVSACTQAGVTLGTNHHLRHAPTIRAMRRVIAGGEIGTPLAARVFHAVLLPESLRTWRVNDTVGGGVALDITVHDADTVRYLLEDEVAEVTAIGANHGLGAPGVLDAMMGVMRFQGDLLAQFHDGFAISHAGTGLEVHGTEGSVVGREVMTQHPVGEVQLRRGEEVIAVDVGERESLYASGVRRFNDAVESGGTPAASAEDGYASLAVGLAAARAAETGRRIRVSEAMEAD